MSMSNIIQGLQSLLASGTPESPVDIHWQNETLKFIVNELWQEEPEETERAFIKYREIQGLV